MWTLDYPPFFAYFEYILSLFAKFFDPGMLQISAEPYQSSATILFQRLTVIISDSVFIYAVYHYLRSIKATPLTRIIIFTLTISNSGLLMVDRNISSTSLTFRRSFSIQRHVDGSIDLVTFAHSRRKRSVRSHLVLCGSQLETSLLIRCSRLLCLSPSPLLLRASKRFRWFFFITFRTNERKVFGDSIYSPGRSRVTRLWDLLGTFPPVGSTATTFPTTLSVHTRIVSRLLGSQHLGHLQRL